MKFLVKDKYKDIPNGMKEIEVNVAEVGVMTGVGLGLVSMAELGKVSLIAGKVIAPFLALGSLPMTTLCGGLLLTVSGGLLISQLIEDYYEGTLQKTIAQTEVEEEALKILTNLKTASFAATKKNKENK